MRSDTLRPRRATAVGRAVTSLAALVTFVAALTGGAGAAAAGTGGIDDPPPPPVTVNEFLPEDRDLSDCLSALPKPGCGSEARGGWRQGLVFGVLVAGLGVIGWRITRAIRRRDATLNAATSDPTPDPTPDPTRRG